MDGASNFFKQTITADTTPAPIGWPVSSNPNAEVQIYVSTPNGPVELVQLDSEGAGDGIAIPGTETNYAAGRWKINALIRPGYIYAAAPTDCEVLILVYG